MRKLTPSQKRYNHNQAPDPLHIQYLSRKLTRRLLLGQRKKVSAFNSYSEAEDSSSLKVIVIFSRADSLILLTPLVPFAYLVLIIFRFSRF